MSSHINRIPTQRVFEPFWHQIRFDVVLSVTPLKQNTVDMAVCMWVYFTVCNLYIWRVSWQRVKYPFFEDLESWFFHRLKHLNSVIPSLKTLDLIPILKVSTPQVNSNFCPLSHLFQKWSLSIFAMKPFFKSSFLYPHPSYSLSISISLFSLSLSSPFLSLGLTSLPTPFKYTLLALFYTESNYSQSSLKTKANYQRIDSLVFSFKYLWSARFNTEVFGSAKYWPFARQAS